MKKTISWVLVGISAIMLSFYLMESAFLSAFIALLSGLVILPPFVSMIEERVGKSFNFWYLPAVWLILLIITIPAQPQALKDKLEARQLKQEQERAEQARQEQEAQAKEETKEKPKAKNEPSAPQKTDTTNQKKYKSLFGEESEEETMRIGIKYGLSEVQRQDVFKEIVLAERRAMSETEAVIDISKIEGTDLQRMEAFNSYRASLEEKYLNAVYQKYKITKIQATNISVESKFKKWEYPPNKK